MPTVPVTAFEALSKGSQQSAETCEMAQPAYSVNTVTSRKAAAPKQVHPATIETGRVGTVEKKRKAKCAKPTADRLSPITVRAKRSRPVVSKGASYHHCQPDQSAMILLSQQTKINTSAIR